MPEERDGPVRAAELHRRIGAEMEHVAIHLDQSDLLLTRPVRKQTDVYFVPERLLGLVDIKGARIGDVAAARSNVFIDLAAVHVTAFKISTTWRAQLRRHVAIRRIHDDALGLLPYRLGFRARIDILFHIGDETPGSDQLFTKSFLHCLTSLSRSEYRRRRSVVLWCAVASDTGPHMIRVFTAGTFPKPFSASGPAIVSIKTRLRIAR
jgi:hypothetical protein